MNESGASVTIGASTGTSALDNTSTGIYDLLGDVGLLKGASSTSSITNEGLLEKTGGTGDQHDRPRPDQHRHDQSHQGHAGHQGRGDRRTER